MFSHDDGLTGAVPFATVDPEAKRCIADAGKVSGSIRAADLGRAR